MVSRPLLTIVASLTVAIISLLAVQWRWYSAPAPAPLTMSPPSSLPSLLATALPTVAAAAAAAADVDLGWYPPRNTSVNNLTTVLDDAAGVYGFVFDSSDTPAAEYGVYNWCNMPHVRKTEYVRAPEAYELVYVEVTQRHHKRTPYASNSFPVEPYEWNCSDAGLYYYGQPFPVGGDGDGDGKQSAASYWQGYISAVNPFTPGGWTGTCQFPQETAGGLDDAWVHGADLYGVYHDLLGLLPSRDDDDDDDEDEHSSSWRDVVRYRVTQNVITSQVAGMLIHGTWRTTNTTSVPLLIQADGVDSLEPGYGCAAADALYDDAIESTTGAGGGGNARWAAHLDAAAPLFAALDAVSGVPADDAGFHVSFDHYFDNLSARQCHGRPLPCSSSNSSSAAAAAAAAGSGSAGSAAANANVVCVNQTLADAVYRMGEWEYSHIYRDAGPAALAAAAASYGVWVAELAAHLREAMAGTGNGVVYFHNVAHDGSLSRLLAIMQVDVMVWPGMGSEVIFELYRKKRKTTTTTTTTTTTGGGGGGAQQNRRSHNGSGSGSGSDGDGEHYVRVLWGGKVMTSSNPSLGVLDMLPVETLLAYFDGLVGANASLVVGKCNGTIST